MIALSCRLKAISCTQLFYRLKNLSAYNLLPITYYPLFLVFIAGCVTIYNPATQRRETYFINDRAEVTIGRNIAQDILRKNKLVEGEKQQSLVKKLGEEIAAASDRKDLQYHFYLLARDEINAFSLPGGYVFVNKGLFDKFNRDELAFVLGHEIGHISARHSVKRLQASLGMSILLSIALRKPDYQSVKKAIDIVYNVISLGYSRKDEFLADSLGVKYMYEAGYNFKGAVSALEKLKKEDRESPPLVFLRSHPLPDARIKNIREKIEELNRGKE